MPGYQGVKTPHWLHRLRVASRISGLLSVLVPVMIFWSSYSATRSDERVCGMILLGGILGSAVVGTIVIECSNTWLYKRSLRDASLQYMVLG